MVVLFCYGVYGSVSRKLHYDRIRGHGKSEDECIAQIDIQNCFNYSIIQVE